MYKVDELTREQMWQLLEEKRFVDLGRNGMLLQGSLVSQARCPKCTLNPPCKHYARPEELLGEA